MKKIIVLVLLLIAVPIAIAQEVYTAQSVVMDLGITSQVELVPRSSDYRIEYLTANFSFFPSDGINQKILGLTTTPKAVSTDEYGFFRIDDPEVGGISFSISAEVKTNDKRVEVKEKIPFPIQSLPSNVVRYTQPSITIDSNNLAIITMASQIAAGEDDMYVVVHKIGAWVKDNVEYDLSTLTAGVTQKASWALSTRQGVCDEITNLFIAMLRSLGIPAKFVSGVAYTEAIGSKWGNHGWAEVYFPGYGWVPFDVTYGQFGYIDPSHITLHSSLDAEDSSTRYQWYGSGLELRTNELQTSVSLEEIIGQTPPIIRLSAVAAKENIGFGSYNLIEANIENRDDSYYATELHISKSAETTVIGPDVKFMLLKPYEKKKVFWIIRIDDNLKRTSTYTFPIVVWSTKNLTAETSFTSQYSSKEYSLDDMNDILSQKQVEDLKTYSKNVELTCVTNKPQVYIGDTATITCYLKNIGNVMLEDIQLCGGECDTVNLGISQIMVKEYLIKPTKAGSHEFAVSANSDDVSKNTYVQYMALDKPSISINNVNYPTTVPYGDEYSVEFTVSKESLSVPKNLLVELYRNGLPKGWRMNKLELDKPFNIKLDSTDLGLGENDFEIRVDYEDDYGNKFRETTKFRISLTSVPTAKKAAVFLKSAVARFEGLVISVMRRFEGMSMQTMLYIFVGLMFVLIVVTIMNKKPQQ